MSVPSHEGPPLAGEGLVRTSPLSSDDRAVTLTDRGRDLLEADRYERDDRIHQFRQTFYASVRKPRELTRDTNVYRAYERAEKRLRGQDKCDHQRFLHVRNRGKKDCSIVHGQKSTDFLKTLVERRFATPIRRPALPRSQAHGHY